MNRPGGMGLLSDEEETALVEYVKYCAERGFPTRRSDLRVVVQEIVAKSSIPERRALGINGPSDHWFKKFTTRHHLSEKIPQTRDNARSRMSNEYIIDEFFKMFSK